MQYRALDDALKTDGGLCIHVPFARDNRRMFVNKLCDELA